MTADHPIILFDGVCNLCNSSVQFVIRKDRKKIFRFTSLQSEAGQAILTKAGLPASDFTSFLLAYNGKTYTQSSAALRVARILGGPIALLYGFIIVPAFLRNGVYTLISRNRYRWFGKKESCMVPTQDLKDRFL